MFTRNQRIILLALVALAVAFRVAIVHWLPNNSADDGLGYAQIARNVLEHHVYSHATEPPFNPSFVRVPGYPLFLAAIYSVFGHTNNSAVRIVQALMDTATCVLIAVLAFLWHPVERHKTNTAIAALAVAAVNPFTTIYAATILTEVPAMFFIVAACLAATVAFKSDKLEYELRWWSISGILLGVGVLFRPDIGLVGASIGVLVLLRLFRRSKGRWRRTLLSTAIFSVAFVLVLAPWTIRNWRAFHVFQPLAPLNANMPGEFVATGYERWLKTWMTDREFLDDLLWELDKQQIDVDELPDSAFDSQAEHDRVSDLFDQYNGPSADNNNDDDAQPAPSPSSSPAGSPAVPSSVKNANSNSEDANDPDQGPDANNDRPEKPGQMTPAIDAGFAQIANERIARHPFRYYLLLPAKRAHSLWFNTHSDFYPFDGDALPLNNPDHSPGQNFWLPIFAVIVAIYTLLGVAGFVLLAMSESFYPSMWALLVVLVFATRLGLFSMAVSIEPRYVVEFFPFLSALGGIAIAEIVSRLKRRAVTGTPETA
ncbi:MAG: ArnT family glycosyltransferase [Pyrinomonadaceae bacterium]